MEKFLTVFLKGFYTLIKIAVVSYVLLWLVGGVLIPGWDMFVLKK